MDVTIEKDDDGHWYWIPNRLLSEFKNDLISLHGFDYMDKPDEFDKFSDTYGKYRTNGAPELMPEFFKKRTT